MLSIRDQLVRSSLGNSYGFVNTINSRAPRPSLLSSDLNILELPPSQLPMPNFASYLVCKLPGSDSVNSYIVDARSEIGLPEYASPLNVYRTPGSNLSCDHRESQPRQLTLTAFKMVDSVAITGIEQQQNPVHILFYRPDPEPPEQDFQAMVKLLFAASDDPNQELAAWAPFDKAQLEAEGMLIFTRFGSGEGLYGLAVQFFPGHLGIKLELVE